MCLLLADTYNSNRQKTFKHFLDIHKYTMYYTSNTYPMQVAGKNMTWLQLQLPSVVGTCCCF